MVKLVRVGAPRDASSRTDLPCGGCTDKTLDSYHCMVQDTHRYLISDESRNCSSNFGRYCLGPNRACCSTIAAPDPQVCLTGKPQ